MRSEQSRFWGPSSPSVDVLCADSELVVNHGLQEEDDRGECEAELGVISNNIEPFILALVVLQVIGIEGGSSELDALQRAPHHFQLVQVNLIALVRWKHLMRLGGDHSSIRVDLRVITIPDPVCRFHSNDNQLPLGESVLASKRDHGYPT